MCWWQLLDIDINAIFDELDLDVAELERLTRLFSPLGPTLSNFSAVFSSQTSENLQFVDLIRVLDEDPDFTGKHPLKAHARSGRHG